MSGLSGRLLDTEQTGGVQRKRKWRIMMALVVVGLVVGTCMLVGGNPRGQETLLREAGWGSAKCYKYTGGTCYLSGCNDNRSAVCTEGRCYCEKGCVGADGLCKPDVTEYKLIAKNLKLRNVKWPDQYIYTPRTPIFEQLRTAARDLYYYYAYSFNLYQLPGDMWVPKGTYPKQNDRAQGFYLSPTEYPEFAVGVASSRLAVHVPFSGKSLDPVTHQDNGGITFPIGSQYVIDLYHLTKRHLMANLAPFNPELALNSICRPKSHPNAIQLLGGFGQIAWYTHEGSWEVFGWVFGNPEQGGYWIPEPQLDIALPDCPEKPT